MRIKDDFEAAAKQITEKQRMYLENARKDSVIKTSSVKQRAVPGHSDKFLFLLIITHTRIEGTQRVSPVLPSGRNTTRLTSRGTLSKSANPTLTRWSN